MESWDGTNPIGTKCVYESNRSYDDTIDKYNTKIISPIMPTEMA